MKIRKSIPTKIKIFPPLNRLHIDKTNQMNTDNMNPPIPTKRGEINKPPLTIRIIPHEIRRKIYRYLFNKNSKLGFKKSDAPNIIQVPTI